MTWPKLYEIFAMPRLSKMSLGRLPVGMKIPITAGNGPSPSGRETVEVRVSVSPRTVTFTVSLPFA